MNHLSKSVQEIASLDDNTRIGKILSDKWIGYTRAKNILCRLDELFVHPKTHRMPNLLLIGPTNNGKTLLLSKFFQLHKPVITPSDVHLNIPVIYIQMPHKPDERRFYNVILETLNAPQKANDRIEKKHGQVLSILKKIETRMLIIDELHHILAGNYSNQRAFLNLIKYLSNELQMVIVGAGINDAYHAINTDQQMANRFEPALLPKWKFEEEYLRLLKSFEALLPLRKPSNLESKDKAMKILSMSEGIIGEMATILRKSAILAIQSKGECITKQILDKIDYISPADRKRQFESVS
ncbi:TniB family NTP-binding protein [Paraflavisolibacter sp. H34]|uniref:TniB family NTP-binding protein n=1 Tax=Huijunlia imazamoxiresistens TaxID=3127457 RepID=UPI003019CB45